MGSSWFGRGVWFFQWSLRELCGTAAALAPQPVFFSDGQPWSERTPRGSKFSAQFQHHSEEIRPFMGARRDVFVGFRLGERTGEDWWNKK